MAVLRLTNDFTVHKSMMSAVSVCDVGLDVNCPVCLDSADDRLFTCDICNLACHGPCTGLSEEVCKVFITNLRSLAAQVVYIERIMLAVP